MKHRITRQFVAFAAALLAAGSCAHVEAQQPSLSAIVERLDRLEKENAALRAEVGQLRTEIDGLRGGGPVKTDATVEGLNERLDIAERRVEEQAQTKVEATQKFPVRLTGVLFANLFRNGPHAGGLDNPTTAVRLPGARNGGMTFRQSIVGFEFSGPRTVWGSSVRGSVFMDFYDGGSEPFYSPMRLRTAKVGLYWNTRAAIFGVEKPLVALRDPASFSYSGISPLTGSGNLWRWQPQVRFEQTVGAGPTTVNLQAAVVQTSEDIGLDGLLRTAADRRRPGLQGRAAFAHSFDDTRRIEFAPSFHLSSSHALGATIGSHVIAIDWFAKPAQFLEFTGSFFNGRNLSHFGATRQSLTLFPNGRIVAVRARGGWGQFTVPFTPRLSLNLFGGTHDDRNRDILLNGIAANRTGAVNLMYRFAPNVVVSIEALQLRTTYLDSGTFKNNRYDLSVAYFF